MIDRAGAQNGRWKRWLVGRIGEALGLKGKTVRLTIRAAPANHGAVQIVAGVKLRSGMGRVNLKYPAAQWVSGTGGKARRLSTHFSKNKVMIVSLPVTQLKFGVANAGRCSYRLAEIEHRLVNRTDFTRRYLLCIRGKKGIGRYRELVVEYIACRKSGEIEVRMGAEADRCSFRGFALELKAERMILFVESSG